MHTANLPAVPRRSSRVQTAVPILVTSLDDTHFSEVCETLVVSAHGCSMLSRMKFSTGAPLHFHSKDGRQATAHVVSCDAIGKDSQTWRLGAMLDQPENFWGLQNCPKDWMLPPASTTTSLPPAAVPTSTRVFRQVTRSSSSALGAVAPHIEVHMKKMIADTVRPLHDEITALKQMLSQRDANPSRFEVSLSSIPPELEHQMELRLRRYIGPRLLEETRQESAHLLESATSAIDQKTAQAYQDFLNRSEAELKVVEKRAEEISAHISANTRENLGRGLDSFQQKVVDSGNALKRLSEELLSYLQQNLNAEHDARREELEQLRTSITAESLRLHEHIDYLDGRIAKLNDSARSLESGLDQRLSQMANRAVGDAGTQLEALAHEICQQFTEQSAKELSDRLKAARENLDTTQTGIVAYVREALKSQSAEALQSFERSMDELATHCIEQWRAKLASGLNSLARNIANEIQLVAESGAQPHHD